MTFQGVELLEYFNLPDDNKISLETISKSRNWILKGEEADIKRCSLIVLSTFRDGKIGHFTLERPQEYGLI